ncbi:MAG: SCP2 sterol-binding domain-containing protein [Actinomycetota bacterium]
MSDEAQPAQGNGAGEAPDFSKLSADEFAALVANVTDEQLAEGMNGPGRELALREIFNRMAEHVNPDKIKGQDSVIHFKILDRPDGGYDHFEVVLRDGTCTVTDEPAEEPKVTIKVPPVEFLKLITNQTSGPALFMTGKLKLEGDIMFASQVTTFFKIPTAKSSGDSAGTEASA